jgi:hypothetical protein
MAIFNSYVSLPEGISSYLHCSLLKNHRFSLDEMDILWIIMDFHFPVELPLGVTLIRRGYEGS